MTHNLPKPFKFAESLSRCFGPVLRRAGQMFPANRLGTVASICHCLGLRLLRPHYPMGFAFVAGMAILVAAVVVPLPSEIGRAAKVSSNKRFENEEIRVIRPRYFIKRKKFELGAQFQSVMDETFIYTFLARGLATYHFNEYFALEFDGSFGQSVDKENKRILFDEFEINTKILRTSYIMGANVLVTPIYGKWQLPDGDLIYFDTFVDLGFGQTGIEWRYNDSCEDPSINVKPGEDPKVLPSNTTIAYPTMFAGVGQRYFTSQNSAVRWDMRYHILTYNKEDSECDPASVEPSTEQHDYITFAFGLSHFF